MSDKRIWKWIKWAVAVLVVITFTPLVTPTGIYKPQIFGIPFTLWSGMIVSLLIVGLVWWGTRVHPGRNE